MRIARAARRLTFPQEQTLFGRADWSVPSILREWDDLGRGSLPATAMAMVHLRVILSLIFRGKDRPRCSLAGPVRV